MKAIINGKECYFNSLHNTPTTLKVGTVSDYFSDNKDSSYLNTKQVDVYLEVNYLAQPHENIYNRVNDDTIHNSWRSVYSLESKYSTVVDTEHLLNTFFETINHTNTAQWEGLTSLVKLAKMLDKRFNLLLPNFAQNWCVRTVTGLTKDVFDDAFIEKGTGGSFITQKTKGLPDFKHTPPALRRSIDIYLREPAPIEHVNVPVKYVPDQGADEAFINKLRNIDPKWLKGQLFGTFQHAEKKIEEDEPLHGDQYTVTGNFTAPKGLIQGLRDALIKSKKYDTLVKFNY